MAERAEISLEKEKDRLHLEALKRVGNAFALVILAAKRVRQLNAGRPRLVERKWDRLDLIALDEIAQGKVLPATGEGGDAEGSAG